MKLHIKTQQSIFMVTKHDSTKFFSYSGQLNDITILTACGINRAQISDKLINFSCTKISITMLVLPWYTNYDMQDAKMLVRVTIYCLHPCLKLVCTLASLHYIIKNISHDMSSSIITIKLTVGNYLCFKIFQYRSQVYINHSQINNYKGVPACLGFGHNFVFLLECVSVSTNLETIYVRSFLKSTVLLQD